MTEVLESAVLTSLDATPVIVPTMGEGASYNPKSNEDIILTTTAIDTSSTYRMGPRIPTNAKVKKVELVVKGADSNSTATLAADINLIFSDAPLGGIAAGHPVEDGTSTTNADKIPTSALTGATTTTTAYSSPNKMFGSALVIAANSGATKQQDITYANTFTTAMSLLPLWSALGYTVEPNGFFNFYIKVTTGAATAAAGSLYLKVTYAV